MDIYQRIVKEGNQVFRELIKQGIGFEITPTNKLRITVKTTIKQFELIWLWKAQIIEEISPKCSNCTLPMNLIEKGKLWFCSFGCENKEAK